MTVLRQVAALQANPVCALPSLSAMDLLSALLVQTRACLTVRCYCRPQVPFEQARESQAHEGPTVVLQTRVSVISERK